MRIECPHCGFSKELADDAVPAGTVKANCPKCRQSFSLQPPEQPAEAAAATEDLEADRAPARSAERLAADALPKAGFWIRLVAALLDTIIVFILQFLLGSLLALAGFASLGFAGETAGNLALLVQLFAYALGFAYYVVFTGYCGQTPGKMALRIKVIRRDGSPIGYGRAAFREIPAKFIAGIIFGIGYLMVAFDEQKQGLHDRMADTYVIKL